MRATTQMVKGNWFHVDKGRRNTHREKNNPKYTCRVDTIQNPAGTSCSRELRAIYVIKVFMLTVTQVCLNVWIFVHVSKTSVRKPELWPCHNQLYFDICLNYTCDIMSALMCVCVFIAQMYSEMSSKPCWTIASSGGVNTQAMNDCKKREKMSMHVQVNMCMTLHV